MIFEMHNIFFFSNVTFSYTC